MRVSLGIKGKSFIKLLSKWAYHYGIKYVYFVIKEAEEIKLTKHKDITIGYLIGMLKNMQDKYKNSIFTMVVPSRKDLLANGYNIADLPDYMLSKKERSFLQAVRRDSVENVSDTDVDNVKKMFGLD